MFYLKLALVFIYSAPVILFAVLRTPFQWKNPRLFSETVRMLSKGVLWITGIRVKVLGRENLCEDRAVIYVGNHQSMFDVPVYGVVIPDRVVAIGKKEIAYLPLVGCWLIGSGTILIDRGNNEKAVQSLKQAADTIKRRRVSVAILPEGTRNKSGEGLLPFKKGAFYLAVEAQVEIVPMLISSLRNVAHWDTRTLCPGELKIHLLPPVSTKGLKSEDVSELMNRVRGLMETALAEMNA